MTAVSCRDISAIVATAIAIIAYSGATIYSNRSQALYSSQRLNKPIRFHAVGKAHGVSQNNESTVKGQPAFARGEKCEPSNNATKTTRNATVAVNGTSDDTPPITALNNVAPVGSMSLSEMQQNLEKMQRHIEKISEKTLYDLGVLDDKASDIFRGGVVMMITVLSMFLWLGSMGLAVHLCLKHFTSERKVDQPPNRSRFMKATHTESENQEAQLDDVIMSTSMRSRQSFVSGLPSKDRVAAMFLAESDSNKDADKREASDAASCSEPEVAAEIPESIGFTAAFNLTSPSSQVRSFQWVLAKDAGCLGLPDQSSGPVGRLASMDMFTPELGSCIHDIEHVPGMWTTNAVNRTLVEHGIDVHFWKDARLKRLAEELQHGESTLVVSGTGLLRRMVILVSVVITDSTSGLVVVEDLEQKRKYPDAQIALSMAMQIPEVTPSIMLGPCEHVLRAAKRCLKEKLGVEEGEICEDCQLGVPDGKVTITGSTMSVDADHQSEETNLRYPGLTTLVRKIVVHAKFEAPGDLSNFRDKAFCHYQLDVESDVDAQKYFWKWRSIAEVPSLIRLRAWLLKCGGNASAESNLAPRSSIKNYQRTYKTWQHLDDDICPQTPWLRSQIESLLQKHQTSAEKFGCSTDVLWQHAAEATISFGVSTITNELVCFRDVVNLRVLSPKRQGVLVQKAQSGFQWPSSCQSIHETQWCTARRIARQQLGLEDTALNISFFPKPMSAKLTNGIVERQWIITATIPEGSEQLCSDLHASEV